MIDFSTDGKIYALGYGRYDKGVIKLFDSVNHQSILSIEGTTEKAVALSPDSNYIAFLKEGIQILDINAEKKIWTFYPNFETIESLCFSPDGTLLAAAGEFETDWDFNDPDMSSVALWDLKNGKNLWENRCGLYKKILFSPSGKKLYTIGTTSINRNLTSNISSANVNNGSFRSMFREKFKLRFWDFDISSDGNTLICAGGYYHYKRESVPIIIVDLNSKSKKVVDNHGTYFTKNILKQLIGHTEPVNSVAYSPDGKRAASASNDVRIWDIESKKQIHQIEKYTEKVKFSPDGDFLVFLSERKLYFYDTTTWKIIKETRVY